MSAESRAKMSAAAKRDGRRPPSRKGIPHSDEHKRRMSEKMKGRTFSDETKRKRLASVRRGPDCHFWKGGVTSEHRMIRASLAYKTWRKDVFERDAHTCRVCGERGGRINAHHIQRFADYPKLRFDVENGLTLCEACHKLTDNFGRWGNLRLVVQPVG